MLDINAKFAFAFNHGVWTEPYLIQGTRHKSLLVNSERRPADGGYQRSVRVLKKQQVNKVNEMLQISLGYSLKFWKGLNTSNFTNGRRLLSRIILN